MIDHKIDTILWDVDATLLDFEASEEVSIRRCFQKYDVTITDEELEQYKKINRSYWERFERKEITKDYLYPARFQEFFDWKGINGIDPAVMNLEYQIALGDTYVVMPDAVKVCEYLSHNYRQYVVTNGSVVAQNAKLTGSGLLKYMKEVFISEKMGTEKPSKEFFDLCAEKIEHYDKETTVIIGDSLTSDMQGGNNAGIKCCWFNPKGQMLTKPLKIDWEIRTLAEVMQIF